MRILVVAAHRTRVVEAELREKGKPSEMVREFEIEDLQTNTYEPCTV